MRILLFLIGWSLALACAGKGSKSHTLDQTLLDDDKDDHAVVQKLINELPSGSVLHIPAGTLVLSKPLLIDKDRFAIIGIDANLSVIHFSGSEGGVVVQSSGRAGRVRFADLSLICTKPAGIAVHGRPVSAGNEIKEHPFLELERVYICGKNNGYWSYSIKSESGAAIVTDCIFRGINRGDNGTLAHMDYSGKTGGGGRITMYRTQMQGAKKGVAVYRTDSEGQKFIDCIVEDVEIGGERLTSEPTFHWLACNIDAQKIGLYLSGARDSVFCGSAIDVSDENGHCVILEKRTMQGIAFRGNLLRGNQVLKVNSKDYQGKRSSKVNAVTFSGNYISGANEVYDLTGPDTSEFSFSGNVIKGASREFVLDKKHSSRIYKTRTKELQ